jgi:hypothetical protein
MGAWLIALVGFIYLATAISLYVEGKTGLAIAFLGYAFANIGLYLDVVKP